MCNHNKTKLLTQFDTFSVQVCNECEKTVICLEYENVEKVFTPLELRSKVDELVKWQTWHPTDEDLQELQLQAKDKNGEYKSSLLANHIYIGALEAKLRSFEYFRERKNK